MIARPHPLRSLKEAVLQISSAISASEEYSRASSADPSHAFGRFPSKVHGGLTGIPL
ncbi:hypothetical protein HFC70_24885 [Agrobacterium sp. a22-2]|uniref:hypothetical protein n=1 Tax=Agrobacterium sp. a22-2 TaxID=2283840 RepID=UPI001444F1E3|nr:hypothetical protein [Agrobacterium sp. a22-2]NKN39587.1 hypothetical protein [Agrobacterium sp. a22-2]